MSFGIHPWRRRVGRSKGSIEFQRRKALQEEAKPIYFVSQCYECGKTIIKDMKLSLVYQISCRCDVPSRYYFVSLGKHKYNMSTYSAHATGIRRSAYAQAAGMDYGAQSAGVGMQIDSDLLQAMSQAADAMNNQPNW